MESKREREDHCLDNLPHAQEKVQEEQLRIIRCQTAVTDFRLIIQLVLICHCRLYSCQGLLTEEHIKLGQDLIGISREHQCDSGRTQCDLSINSDAFETGMCYLSGSEL